MGEGRRRRSGGALIQRITRCSSWSGARPSRRGCGRARKCRRREPMCGSPETSGCHQSSRLPSAATVRYAQVRRQPVERARARPRAERDAVGHELATPRVTACSGNARGRAACTRRRCTRLRPVCASSSRLLQATAAAAVAERLPLFGRQFAELLAFPERPHRVLRSRPRTTFHSVGRVARDSPIVGLAGPAGERPGRPRAR